MFTLIEALNYRCLRYISQPLGPFHVLVGPNGSGKTTFLDVIAFLGDMLADGLEEALFRRSSSFEDLTWARRGSVFEFAVEVLVPEERRAQLTDPQYDTFRYEVAVGVEEEGQAACFLRETGMLTRAATSVRKRAQPSLFPELHTPPETLFVPAHKAGKQTVFSKRPGQDDNYYPETTRGGTGGWMPAFKLGPRRSTLANLPEDESRFPVATWFKQVLDGAVQQIILNSLLMRRASPPRLGTVFRPSGENLPWVIEALRSKAPQRFGEWLDHVRTALPEIVGMRTVENPEDRSRYVVVSHREGIDIPSWLLSDGTLRLLALTLLAYLPDFLGVYLIEEPENGIHPRAIETVFESLSSVYSAQILLATHSPVILNVVDAGRVLCFAKTPDGATDIVPGDRHPRLRDWQREENLGVLFAAGVLG